MEDIELTCVDCGAPFIYAVGEQRFFAEKGFQVPPKRCKPCRQHEKERRELQDARRVRAL
jgi:hypothetical protein